jgi:hypothetical protein
MPLRRDRLDKRTGHAFITIVASVAIWQIFATGRTGLSAKRENAYQKLAQESAEAPAAPKGWRRLLPSWPSCGSAPQSWNGS